MIKLNVEGYCQMCLDFYPDVIPPTRTTDDENVLTDTIVQCKYRKRCAGIKRYLEHQLTGEAQG